MEGMYRGYALSIRIILAGSLRHSVSIHGVSAQCAACASGTLGVFTGLFTRFDPTIAISARFSYYCSCPNPMTLNLTLKVAEFPDALWQEGSPRRGEENKKKFIRIGRPVPEQFRVILEVAT